MRADLSVSEIIIALVLVQRLIEMMIARRNAQRLLEAGAVEHGASHYPLLVLLHALWLGALVFGVPPDTDIAWGWIAAYGVLLAFRVWTMASLGRFWTTRILVVPGAPPVTRGPYRFLRHPNYLVVVGEIAVLPLAFGEWLIALAFSLANAVLLRERIRVEDAARSGIVTPPADSSTQS